MSISALGEAAANLPWLSPCAATLVACARATTPAVWSVVRFDPGMVLLLVRQIPPPNTAPPSLPSLLNEPTILESALDHIQCNDPAFVDWSQPAAAPIYRAAIQYARLAAAIAERTHLADPVRAWIGGLLAPLGWMAASTLNPLSPSALPTIPAGHAALARRLNLAWRLPTWLAAITGSLALPCEVARDLGGDANLFRIVQLAVGLVDRQQGGLGLAVGADAGHLAKELCLSASDRDALDAIATGAMPVAMPLHWQAPQNLPLLPDLLRLAVDKRRLARGNQVEWLHGQVDALHGAVESQRAGEGERLLRHKLSAVAELAAGAGHEINNPLAVISGQAQYLLLHEEDGARRRSLQTIVGQTQRIHQTLTGLMQFARPPQPTPTPVEVAPILRDVIATLQTTAEDKQVQLLLVESTPLLAALADAAQLRTTLICLVRNAIEAAPVQGWARLTVETPSADQLRFLIEDSGPGLTEIDREHLFDPFYSGRKAGRGRGLGLSTAWRLAQQHGGAVGLEETPGGPTRFVLAWPRAELLPIPPMAPGLPPPDVVSPSPAEANGCHVAAATDV